MNLFNRWFELRKRKDKYLWKKTGDYALESLLRLWYRLVPNKGFYVLNEDWDVLIVLDACKYDSFLDCSDDIDGEITKKMSRGSDTKTWIRENFGRMVFRDIVYVAGNPFFYYEEQLRFYDLIHAWKSAWNEKMGTVDPKKVMNIGLKTIKINPSRKVIVHFMQPHAPYISMTTESNKLHKKVDRVSEVMDEFRYGKKLSVKEMEDLYEENIKYVLKYVKEMIGKIPKSKKIVITSDHGESFGKGLTYFHPRGIRTKELTEVPWMICGEPKINYREQWDDPETKGM